LPKLPEGHRGWFEILLQLRRQATPSTKLSGDSAGSTAAASGPPRSAGSINCAWKCHDAAQPISQLSGGNQQKVAIARLLEHPARISSSTNPRAASTSAARRRFTKLIGELAAAGKAVVIISSYLPELLGLCDTVGVMCRGELAAIRPRSQWTETEIMRVATGSA